MANDPIADLEAVRVASVRAWSARCDKRIADRLADARAHAWNALTQRVVSAGDGRATWRAATLTRGWKAALARLDELADALAGPGKASLAGLIRDARAGFYRDSFDLLAGSVPPEIAAANQSPTKAGEAEARGLVIHGLDLRTEIEAFVAETTRALQAVVTAAGGRDESDAAARIALAGWEGRSRDRLSKRVAAVLSDSEVAIFNLVGRSMIDPKYHAED